MDSKITVELELFQERLKDLQGRRGEAQEALDLQRTQFEGFEFNFCTHRFLLKVHFA